MVLKSGNQSGIIANGILDGSVTMWIIKGCLEVIYYPDGKIRKETYYKMGMKHGVERVYFRTGQLQLEASYYNNMLHGRYREYNRDGKLVLNYLYENNKRVE